MLEVKTEALDLLTNLLNTQDVGDQELVRLTATPEGGLGLAIDQARDGDRVVANAQRDVLVVEPAIDAQLADAVLTVGGEQGDQLAIEPKDASA